MDLFPLLVTLIACLGLGVDYGIIIGIAMNLLFILHKTARPVISCEVKSVDGRDMLVVTPDQSLFFSASEYLRYKITKFAHSNEAVRFVIIDGHYIHHMDATVAAGMNTVIRDLEYLNKKVILWNWNKQPMGVIYRSNSDLLTLFKRSPSLHDIMPANGHVPVLGADP